MADVTVFDKTREIPAHIVSYLKMMGFVETKLHYGCPYRGTKTAKILMVHPAGSGSQKVVVEATGSETCTLYVDKSTRSSKNGHIEKESREFETVEELGEGLHELIEDVKNRNRKEVSLKYENDVQRLVADIKTKLQKPVRNSETIVEVLRKFDKDEKAVEAVLDALDRIVAEFPLFDNK